jgi:hypothetical protein
MKHKLIRAALGLLLFLSLLPAAIATAAISYQTSAGFNIIGVTPALKSAHPGAYALLNAWKNSGVTAVESFDRTNKVMLRAELDGSNNPAGNDFPLQENEALFLYAGTAAALDLGDVPECSPLSLDAGFGLKSFFCLPSAFHASDLINSLGIPSILSVSKFDNRASKWITAAVNNGTIVGEDFPLLAGEGYIIYAAAEVVNWVTPLQRFSFDPATASLHQEESGISLNLTIPFPAPAGGVPVGLLSSDPSTLTVPALVTIPGGTSSVSVPVTALPTGSPVDQVVQVRAARPNWTDGTAAVTVKPKLTVNLAPTTTLTGKGWTYYLTVSLTEAAPTGGLIVTLTTSTTGVVSCPATATVPAGATSAQVTVTALNPGTVTITATSPQALTGTTNIVTVKPVQTVDIGPVLGAPVGVMVTKPSSTAGTTATYKPVTSSSIGVAVGSVITGLSPDRGAIGTTDMLLRINGAGLAAVTSVAFLPPDGITVQDGTLAYAGDGSFVDVRISLADTAPVSQRTVIVTSASGTVRPAAPGANSFRVTHRPPQLWSLIPNSQVTGTTFTLQVNGRNLQQASEIAFIPPDDISVGNPPTVSSYGTLASVTASISSAAAAGYRTVAITAPGGSTTSAPSAANAFEVRSSTPPPGNTYAAYTPIVSPSVGVAVQTPVSSTTQTATYKPVTAAAVGVAVGPVISAITPPRGAIGTTGLAVRVNGTGLAAATGMTFNPSTGITVQDGTFRASADGGYAEAVIDIAQNAPVTTRTVLLGGAAARPAGPGANLFTVTLPMPEILSIQPISKQTGSTFTLTVFGRNLNSASTIDFTPPDGVTVANPPSVSTDGTLATATVILAPNAPVGARVVTITTPGGTTSATPTPANTFTITALPPTVYSQLVAPQVGILVTQPSTTSSRLATYSPVLALPVGVMVTTAPSPTSAYVTYRPVVSPSVGVAVGPVITGIAPAAIEPGTTQNITIYGAGLNDMAAVQFQPPTGLTIGTPVPAGDGLSAVVSVTTSSTVAVGPKTLVVSSASGAVRPSVSYANILLTGPTPTISSMTVGAGSPLAAAGTTVTLTINGSHLQGATEVRFDPAADILVNNPPTYYADGQGEHLSVTIIIAFTASGGERVVTVTTPYGASDAAASPNNTFTVVAQIGGIAPGKISDEPVLARGTAVPSGPVRSGQQFDPRGGVLLTGLTTRPWEQKRPVPPAEAERLSRSGVKPAMEGVRDVFRPDRAGHRSAAGSRGPPLFPA